MRLGFTVRTTVLFSVAALSALALACSGGGETKQGASTPAPGKASTAAASSGSSASSAGSAAVAVDLTEWSVKAASASAKAGKVELTAKNGGSTPHELVVLKTDVDAGALQKDASGKVDEAKYPPAGRTKQLDNGASEKLEVSLTAGKYVLLCNIPGHYDLGMRTSLTVN